MDTAQLVIFTAIWTFIWTLPTRYVSRRFELIIGLIPFTAFGLRVFVGFFTDVPPGDPVRDCVGPLIDWVNGSGILSFQCVLDAAVAVGLFWFAAAFSIPRQSRLATAWIIPAIAATNCLTLYVSGLPIEKFFALALPSPVLSFAVAGLFGVTIRWTPSPLTTDTRQNAAIFILITLPVATSLVLLFSPLVTSLPIRQQAQATSLLTLGAGALVAVAAYQCHLFTATRSKLLFALVAGVSVGALASLSLAHRVNEQSYGLSSTDAGSMRTHCISSSNGPAFLSLNMKPIPLI
jgi:hypothetical protein